MLLYYFFSFACKSRFKGGGARGTTRAQKKNIRHRRGRHFFRPTFLDKHVITQSFTGYPKTNLGQPLLRSDKGCVFSNARWTKFHFINLMRRAIFVFRYVRFFRRRPYPKCHRVELAPVRLPCKALGDDVPTKKNGRTWKKILLVSSSL